MRCRLTPLGLALCSVAVPTAASDPPAWTRSIAPFPIVGNIWYVGTEGLAAYLIKSEQGAILIDATMAENVPAIERNIVTAGVKLADVKWILVSHAHFDHAAGDAAMKAATGARLAAGEGDKAALESGIPPGETNYGIISFPPVKVDRALHDGDTIKLGSTTLTAIATPGHTPGCTTYAMRSGKLRIIFPCSLTVAGNRLVGNRRYPAIVADYRASFRRLAAIKADVVLPAHPEFADVLGREKRQTAGATDAFLAPGLLGRIVAEARTDFDAELARQHGPEPTHD